MCSFFTVRTICGQNGKIKNANCLKNKQLAFCVVLEAGLLNMLFITLYYTLIMLYINELGKSVFSLNMVKSNRNTEMFM